MVRKRAWRPVLKRPVTTAIATIWNYHISLVQKLIRDAIVLRAWFNQFYSLCVSHAAHWWKLNWCVKNSTFEWGIGGLMATTLKKHMVQHHIGKRCWSEKSVTNWIGRISNRISSYFPSSITSIWCGYAPRVLMLIVKVRSRVTWILGQEFWR